MAHEQGQLVDEDRTQDEAGRGDQAAGRDRAAHNVCFLVDEITGPSTWKSVVAHGQYEEVIANRDRQAALSWLTPNGSGPVSRGITDGSRVVVFRIRPREISGRFERQDA